jgi:PAS domain S-box-containing protein
MPGSASEDASAEITASAEERLLEREEQYRRIFDATSDGLIVNDPDTGVVVEVNPAFCRMHGYTYDELIGMHPTQFIHPEDHGLFVEYFEAISQGRAFRARARDLRKDGAVFDVEVHGTTFMFRGRQHLLGVVRDVSAEVAATRLLEQRVAERTHELGSLLSLANRAAATLELEPLVAIVLPEVERVLASSWAAIYLKDGELLVRVGADHDPSVIRQAGLPANWHALAAGEELVDDAEFEPLFPTGGSGACAVVVPLAASGETIGVLCLRRADGEPFAQEQRTLTRGVADQLSVAISNARHYEATQEAAALEERHRIARDLHDSVSQSLFSLTLHARTAELALAKAGVDPEGPLGRPLQEVSRLTRGALAEMRALIFELRPGALAEEGLGAALEKHAAAVTAREGLDISVHAPEQRLALAVEQEEHLYRLAQEALHNIVKHAGAQHAWVEVQSRAGSVVMTVRDDGAGFDPAEPRPGHLGLRTMEDRAAEVGGRLAVRSAPGAGTTVRIELPLATE